MSALLSRLGAAAARRWRRTLLIPVIAVAVTGALAGALGGGFVDDYRTPGVDSQRAQDLLEERFPQVSGGDATLVFSGGDVEGAGVQRTLREVAGQPHVTGVGDLEVSRDGGVAYATVQYDIPAEDLGADARERLETAAEGAGVEVSMRGNVIDIGDEQPAPVGELIGVAAAVLVLTLLFRSVVAMTLTLVAALFGLVGGMALVALASAGVDIPTIAPTLGVMLGLGAGVDYALFLVARHRERLAAGDDPVTAASRANGTAGVAVLTAGAIVVVAISGLLATGIPFVGRMGLAAGAVVAVAAVAAVTVMPALLGMAGRRVLPRADRAAVAPVERAPGFSERWARGVARRPVLSTLAGAGILLALSAPVLGLQLGQPDDGTRPEGTTQRVAYDRLAEGFGAGFNGPLVMAVSLAGDRAAADGALDRLRAGAEASPDVAAVAAPTVNQAGDAATLSVIPRTAPQDQATSQLVEHLRADVIPDATRGTGAVAHVAARRPRSTTWRAG